MPVNAFMWSMAVFPIVFMLFAMVQLKWSASKAAPCAMLLSACIAAFLYKTPVSAIGIESVKGLWNAVVILLVVWPAILLYEISVEANAFASLKYGIQNITRHQLLQIMIVGWVFTSFLQGITGFGVAVAVGAPLLVGLGVAPLWSVVIVLLCHSWGATFGTLSLAWQALLTQTQIPPSDASDAALVACIMIWIYNFTGGFFLCWFYGKWQAIREGAPALVIISTIQGGGQLILAQYDHTISCFLPCCLALAVAVMLGKIGRYTKPWKIADSRIMTDTTRKIEREHMPGMSFHRALFPYYALTAITLFCLLIPPVNHALGRWKIGFSFPSLITRYGFVTKAEAFFSPLAPLTYAGTFLFLASILSYCYYARSHHIGSGGMTRICGRTVKKTIPSSIAIIGLIVMSKIMTCSGQTYVMAEGVVSVMGRWYVLASPLIGMVGSFVTSSNMSSNILFSNFQLTTATLLHIQAAFLLGAQTAGGVIGTSIAPGSVILGTSTTGISGREGEIIKTVLPVSGSAVIGIGVLLGVAVAVLML